MALFAISASDAYPYSAVASIILTYNGGPNAGSGIVVGSNDILTAAHVVQDYAPNAPGVLTDIEIYPGRNGDFKPYGDVAQDGWTRDYNPVSISGQLGLDQIPLDLAIIGVNQPVAQKTGFVPLTYSVDGTLYQNNIIFTAGFPGGQPNPFGSMYYSLAYPAGVGPNYLDVSNHGLVGGNSGGGLWWTVNGFPEVVGVVSTGTYSARITEQTYVQLLRWIEGNGHGATSGDDFLFATNLRSVIDGFDGNDTIYGLGGDDILRGGAGNDVIHGGSESDFITGGLGRDILYGELGRDRFDFNSVLEITGSGGANDVVYGFKHLEDRIDVSTIDARAGGRNNAFHFVGKGPLVQAGDLKFKIVNKSGTKNDVTIVSGDVDGDHKADFALQLKGLVELTKVDFIL
jgi:V8-like Glu-specific endopeptidase